MFIRFLRVFNYQNYLTLEISWITAATAGTDPELNQGEWLAYKLQVDSFILCAEYYEHYEHYHNSRV